MSTNGNLLTSPVGEIQFMAVYQPVTNKQTGKKEREISLLLDNKEAASFIDEVAYVNDAIPVTAKAYRGKKPEVKEALAKGKTKIAAATQFEVPVYDAEGNELEEIPMFFPESTGTAQMVVQPYTKSDKGGSINLVAVILHSLDTPETATTDRETRRAQLQEAIKNATG